MSNIFYLFIDFHAFSLLWPLREEGELKKKKVGTASLPTSIKEKRAPRLGNVIMQAKRGTLLLKEYVYTCTDK